MNRIPITLAIACLILPGVVLAEDFESYVNRMIENAKAGGGTVITENHSSVSTGGQVAGAGETVVTDGDVSASSHSETYINAGNDGGSVYVKTQTSTNGETETKEYTKDLERGKSVEVNVSAKAGTGGTATNVEIQGETMEGTSSVATHAKADVTVAARVEAALKNVPSFVKKILNFVKFW